MMISSIQPIDLGELKKYSVSQIKKEDTFANDIAKMIQVADNQYQSASEKLTNFALGDNIPIHEVIIGLEKAQLNLQMMVEVRNKLLESYQELMRIQL
jgi:flagellar hook-basal body complex protein FliE